MADGPVNDAPYRLIAEVDFGENVIVYPFTNLYGCRIGDSTRIGPYVEIQRGAVIGANCKIQSHTFICDGVTIEDEVFVGHGVMFINDKRPRATTPSGDIQVAGDWDVLPVHVKRQASIGSGAVILGGLSIGERAFVGAGAVVTRDVRADEVVVGNPARGVTHSRRHGNDDAHMLPNESGSGREDEVERQEPDHPSVLPGIGAPESLEH